MRKQSTQVFTYYARAMPYTFRLKAKPVSRLANGAQLREIRGKTTASDNGKCVQINHFIIIWSDYLVLWFRHSGNSNQNRSSDETTKKTTRRISVCTAHEYAAGVWLPKHLEAEYRTIGNDGLVQCAHCAMHPHRYPETRRLIHIWILRALCVERVVCWCGVFTCSHDWWLRELVVAAFPSFFYLHYKQNETNIARIGAKFTYIFLSLTFWWRGMVLRIHTQDDGHFIIGLFLFHLNYNKFALKCAACVR